MGAVYRLARRAEAAPCAWYPRGSWRERLRKEIYESPLIETTPSAAALRRATAPRRPKTVMLGIGLCKRDRLSEGLPLDVLGVLLPAEQVRRALRATSLVVIVADAHAVDAGADARVVALRAADVARKLRRVARVCGLSALKVTRASALQSYRGYRRALAEVDERCERRDNVYVRRQLADVAFMNRALGGVVKVGWTIARSLSQRHHGDEVFFDSRFRELISDEVPFVYCKPGRTLRDARPKAPPYVAVDATARVMLASDENPAQKLRIATGKASAQTVRGVRNHLKAITRLYSEMVQPLSGKLEDRVEVMLRSLVGVSGSSAR